MNFFLSIFECGFRCALSRLAGCMHACSRELAGSEGLAGRAQLETNVHSIFLTRVHEPEATVI